MFGRGYDIYKCNGKKIAVINLIGRASMNVLSDNPFVIADEIITKIKDNVNIIIIDFHAEATAEKIAMGYYLDGKVTCIFGNAIARGSPGNPAPVPTSIREYSLSSISGTARTNSRESMKCLIYTSFLSTIEVRLNFSLVSMR